MSQLRSNLCLKCYSVVTRPNIFQPAHQAFWAIESRRYRSTTSASRARAPSSFRINPRSNSRLPTINTSVTERLFIPPTQISPAQVPATFQTFVSRWASRPRVHARLESFGIPQSDINPLLRKFLLEVQSGHLSNTPKLIEHYHLSRLSHPIPPHSFATEIDVIYSTVFFQWASDPNHQPMLEKIVPLSAVETIRRLTRAADRAYPAEEYAAARKMTRKVIMHVGPTNSGKTHNALRALAASNNGVYAGPLRLLAHEIWERLNKGQIVPLGMEQPQTGGGSGGADINEIFKRKCNMITGEEQKIVQENAPLLSCTVEMLSTQRLYDVAVVDEIQMIADPQRGSGWTNAVLGLCAKEIHLCGEETAVPLVQALLEDTGDELVVHRYERLTPLAVEEESLHNDFGNVRKGDCIVTFSRTSIFAIKHLVEQRTGMRCAVVYGKLPPEIRSEQAALFNDPNSGYDVIIGSDAIGMGLNLKIRRIVFETIKKWDGTSEQQLSVSQMKQIAGRAGRFGLHESPGGFVTTLRDKDLPTLRAVLDIPPRPLPYARVGPNTTIYGQIVRALPPDASTETAFEAATYVSRMQPTYRTAERPNIAIISHFVDKYAGDLPLEDKLQLVSSPVAWKDERSVAVVAKFVRMFQRSMRVRFMDALKGTEFMETMREIEERMKVEESVTKATTPHVLAVMETFHKIVVLYTWMSFRNPVAYSDHAEVLEVKGRLERALDWALAGMSTQKLQVMWAAEKEGREGEMLPHLQRVQVPYQSGREHKLKLRQLKMAPFPPSPQMN